MSGAYDHVRNGRPRNVRDHTALWNLLTPIADASSDAQAEIAVFCERKRITVPALEALGARVVRNPAVYGKTMVGWCLAYAGTNGNGRVVAIKYRPLNRTSHDSMAESGSWWMRPIIVGKLDSLDWLIPEGETDGARLYGLVGDRCAILVLPAGAHTFDPEWAKPIPRGATAGLCHDADGDGDTGAEKAGRIIGGRTVRVRPPIEGGDWCDWDGDRAAFLKLVAAVRVDSPTVAALAESRVDLIELRRRGIPPREFVPGAEGLLAAAKRHHIAAQKKAGKSIAIGVVAAIDIVTAGGIVVVLDRENGEDEYLRRLDAVLRARGADIEFEELVRERFRYHAWPRFRLEWGADPSYAEAFTDADLVIFDSSRKFLTSVGLKEDLSDDYSQFTEALIDPLMRAGIATVILDNEGHEHGRPRGSSSKGDLTEVMFELTKRAEFTVVRRGRVELTCKYSRIGEISGSWTLELGGGIYDSWKRKGGVVVLGEFREAVIDVLRADAPLGRDRLLKAVRERGVAAREETLREWLAKLVEDPTSHVISGDDGYSLEGMDP